MVTSNLKWRARAMPNNDESIHALVEMADEAMYEEKRLRDGAA
jgi:hypothetical protein